MAARKKSASEAKHLGKLAAELRKIPAAELAPPPMPVDKMVAEARALAKVVQTTRAALVKVGLDKKLADSLDVRATALVEAQSQHQLSRRTLRSVREVELEAAGVALRADMVADLRYAARADQDAQSRVDAIQEGEGLDDLVQDLRDLTALFAAHAAPLKRASVDVKGKSKQATALAGELEELVADRRANSSGDGAARELRDRAAAYLQHALSEIRAAGVYAFRSKPAVQAKFRSTHAAAKRAKLGRRKKEAEKVAPEA